MARVTVEDCIEKVDNRFELVLMASHRARAISSGSPINVARDNDKNPVVALREIGDGKLSAGDLREDLIHALQKHVEVDEPGTSDAMFVIGAHFGLPRAYPRRVSRPAVALPARRRAPVVFMSCSQERRRRASRSTATGRRGMIKKQIPGAPHRASGTQVRLALPLPGRKSLRPDTSGCRRRLPPVYLKHRLMRILHGSRHR